MTKKEKKNALIMAGVAGAGLLLWYLWDKKIGPFAPGAALAPASSAPVTNAPNTSNSGATTVNTSAVNAGSYTPPTSTGATTSTPYSHQIYVPFTSATVSGIRRRRIGNIM